MNRYVASALLFSAAWMLLKSPGPVSVPVTATAVEESAPAPGRSAPTERVAKGAAIPVESERDGGISSGGGIVPPEFHALTVPVLLPRAEKEKLDALLADEALQARALEALGSLPASDDEATVAARIGAIDYVARAIEWEKNPSRAALIQRLQAGLEEVSRHLQGDWASKPAALRKVVVADQVELLGLLFSADPEAYAQYRERVKQDSWLARVTLYARNVRQNNGGHP